MMYFIQWGNSSQTVATAEDHIQSREPMEDISYSGTTPILWKEQDLSKQMGQTLRPT